VAGAEVVEVEVVLAEVEEVGEALEDAAEDAVEDVVVVVAGAAVLDEAGEEFKKKE